MAMYSRAGEGRYRASEHTQGPWDPGSQHMGPVTALIVHELARTAPRPGLQLSRLVVDVFAPVPVAELRVETDVARDGKRVQCLSASVRSGGREFARASAWRIREAGTHATPARKPPAPVPPRSQEHARSWLSSGFGYGRALDWRFVTGSPLTPGPATVWGRLGMPLVEGEEITSLERLAVFADSGNGISLAVDFATHLFANVDLTISLFRSPETEWICMESATVLGPAGRGLTRSTLYDENGEVGTATQTLFVAPREP
ncbi:thioesterase family protein [Nonomuraea sp. KC401]|uniref:Thioesterase family protein n=1 Tax=Nonomuraea longispora TaxID=1848320 RepID=A0A4V2XHB6_9ACTN|nr:MULTISPECIES: thioesterase family protein [Nonomuraea]NBE99914.1 thioesterase family protein [Nonomuraea sp. K271]TDB94225.1 thioesterase family protein [Nonomuraea longispora]TLF63149.1 thioesterase family protein [Nonomuraea sp. KC401]